MTACLFSFMDRLVEGHGQKDDPTLHTRHGASLQEGGYPPLLEYLAD